MKILIACEYSGRVRDAFRALGHDAVSCDLLPTEVEGPHYQCDVREVIGMGWDMMIAHPECTYLTNAGVRWLHSQPGRWEKMRHGAEFFRFLLTYERIPLRAIENPVMHFHAVDIVGRRQDQIVQPWMFGDMQCKATGLWLEGLPPLVPTNNVKAETMGLPYGERCRVHHASPGPDRWKERSRTFPGVAAAMAAQWSGVQA